MINKSSDTKGKRKIERSVSNNTKKVKHNPRPPFKNNTNLLIEIPSGEYNFIQYEKYICKILGTSYIFINKSLNPNDLISILNIVYKNSRYIKCNIIIDNYYSDFTKPFHHYKSIRIVKCLMSEIILSSRYDLYNVKIKNTAIESIIPLIQSINFKKRKTDFLSDFKKLFDKSQNKTLPSDHIKETTVNLEYKTADVQNVLKGLIQKYRKESIDTIKLKEKQVLEKLLKQKERRKRIDEKRKMSTKEKPKKTEIVEVKTVEPVPKGDIKEKSVDAEKAIPRQEKVVKPQVAPKPIHEVLTDEELDKHALLTITKNMTTLTTLKKTKPYKIVKIFIRLPIKKFSTVIINDLINSNKTSANIVMVSYINLQDTKVFFQNELKMKELSDSTEREFKVLAIGGGINDVLITLTTIRKAMMMKMAK